LDINAKDKNAKNDKLNTLDLIARNEVLSCSDVLDLNLKTEVNKQG